MSVCLDTGAINQGSGNTQVATEHLTLRRQITKYCSFFFFVFLSLIAGKPEAFFAYLNVCEDRDIFPKEKNASSRSTFFTLKDLKTHVYK